MTKPKPKTAPNRKTATNLSENLRGRVLEDAKTLKLPLSAEILDAALARADQEGLSHLNFLELILGEPAERSRQRAIERRIRDAKFHEDKHLSDFDWKFNGQAIDRAQIEQLATGEFLRRHENLVMVGQSGVGNPRPTKYPSGHRGMRRADYGK
jgi:DNA replication protein DnaC